MKSAKRAKIGNQKNNPGYRTPSRFRAAAASFKRKNFIGLTIKNKAK